MCALAAALPFLNLPGFAFREDDRDPEERERRDVFFRRLPEDFEARFLRRLRPPLSEFSDPVPGQPDIHDIAAPRV